MQPPFTLLDNRPIYDLYTPTTTGARPSIYPSLRLPGRENSPPTQHNHGVEQSTVRVTGTGSYFRSKIAQPTKPSSTTTKDYSQLQGSTDCRALDLQDLLDGIEKSLSLSSETWGVVVDCFNRWAKEYGSQQAPHTLKFCSVSDTLIVPSHYMYLICELHQG